jgi:hypothetical protein
MYLKDLKENIQGYDKTPAQLSEDAPVTEA